MRLSFPAAPSRQSIVTRSLGTDGQADDSANGLEIALAQFQAMLTDEERKRLNVQKTGLNDADAAFKFTLELDEMDPTRQGRTMAPKLCALLQTVQSFAQVVDTYVSSNPQIAALIWGSVKLTFMVLINFTSYFQNFTSLLQGFNHLIPQFLEYERLFPDSQRLKKSICDFHLAIISCCTQIINLTRLPWQQKAWAALTNSFESQIRPAVESIRTTASLAKEEVGLAKAQYDRLNQDEQRKVQKSLLKQSRKSSKGIQSLGRDTRLQTKLRKWELLLNSLSSYDYQTVYKNARSKRHKGTAEWAFDTQIFKDWYYNDQSAVLNITGKIGSGKTVLTASIVDSIVRNRNVRQVISFFFIRFDDITSQSPDVIFRSLIRQVLAHNSVDDDFLTILENSKSQFFDHESLLELFNRSVTAAEDTFLVLDGLDECSTTDQHFILKGLSSFLQRCPKGRIKIMVSGRDSVGDTIARSLPAVSRLIVGSEHTNRDLALFAKDILREKQEEGEWEVGDQSLINEILDVISIGGEGMFLWAFLTIEDICTRRNDDEVREALLDIPRNLPETFDRALRRIDQKGNTEIAQSVFKWTAAVNSPLTLSQFAEVLKIKINQRSSQESQRINGINRLPAWCENLVQVEEGSETVHFSHHSISAYLLGSTEKPNHLFNLDLRDCDGFVGEICLTYLNFSDFQRALAGRPHDNLTPTIPNNVPHKVVDRTVESLMAKKYGKGIARLIKMQFKESQPLSLGRSAMPGMSSADGLSDTNMTRDYPFLRYAKENWPWHTRNISTSSRTWRLWNNIDASADYAPWTNLDWNPPGIPRRDFSSLLSGATEILVRPPYECDIRLRFALHRAFAYADLLDHHPLVDKVISTLVDNGLNLNTVLLEMLLQSVLAQDLPLGSKERYQEEQRAHHRLVCSVTGFIARGGKTWPSSYVHQDENIGFPKSCDTWRHKGIYQDVCAIVRGHPSGVDITREMQLYAKLSTMDLHEEAIIEFQKDVREHFKDRPRLSIIPTGDFHARGFVDIAIQRGGPGSAKLVRWLLNEAGDLSDLSPQEVLSFLNTALKARNEDALEALLDENKLAKSHSFQSIQETTVLHALRDMWLPRELRKRFITFCIPSQRYADDHVAGCAGRSLLKAVLCDAWDFAVALRRCGGSLADGEITKHKKLLPNTEATCRLFDAVLDCAASQSAEVWHCDLRQSPEVATQWLAYCPAHRTQASQVLQSYKLLDHDPMQNDPERLLDALRRTYFTTRHVKPCRGFVIGDDSNRK